MIGILILFGAGVMSIVFFGRMLFAVFSLFDGVSIPSESALGRWLDKYGNKVGIGVVVAFVLAGIVFFFQVEPRWDAEAERRAPRDFVEAWGNGGQHGEGAYALYDNRIFEFRQTFFEAYCPTNVVEIKEDGEGILGFDKDGSYKPVKMTRYIVTTKGVSGWGAYHRGAPMTMKLMLNVSKDKNRVCFVGALSEEVLETQAECEAREARAARQDQQDRAAREPFNPQQQRFWNAIVGGSGERKTVEPDASSVQSPVTEPTVNVAMTERQMELLRQDVAEVATYESFSRMGDLPGRLTECAGDRLKDWRTAAVSNNCDGLFMLSMYRVFGQSGEDKQTGIEMLQAASAGGIREANYWLGVAYFGGAGVPKNVREAAKWYEMAAWQGHVWAQYSLGLLYGDDRSIIFNPDRAMGWLAKAAQQGMPEAQRAFAERLREDERVAVQNNGKLPAGFTRIELGADGKIKVGR